MNLKKAQCALRCLGTCHWYKTGGCELLFGEVFPLPTIRVTQALRRDRWSDAGLDIIWLNGVTVLKDRRDKLASIASIVIRPCCHFVEGAVRVFLGDWRLRYKHQWGKGLTTWPPVGSSLWRPAVCIQGRHFGAQCKAAPALCRSQVSGGSALLGSDLSHLDKDFQSQGLDCDSEGFNDNLSKMVSGNSCRLVVVLCVFGSVRHAGAPRLVSVWSCATDLHQRRCLECGDSDILVAGGSIRLWHQFWTDENKLRFPEVAWEYFNYQQLGDLILKFGTSCLEHRNNHGTLWNYMSFCEPSWWETQVFVTSTVVSFVSWPPGPQRKMTPEFWTALPRKIEALREPRHKDEP